MPESSQPKILVFAGSTRAESWNKKLARLAADAVRAAGGDATLLDLRDFALPLYDGDLEAHEGLPAGARELKAAFKSHHGLVIASPEYNSSISGVLKNAIDWVSRPVPGERPLEPFLEKVAALVSASPGQLGGLRGLVHLRAILGNIQVLVIPEQLAIPKAPEAFEADGSLKDAKQRETLERIARRLVTVTAKLRA